MTVRVKRTVRSERTATARIKKTVRSKRMTTERVKRTASGVYNVLLQIYSYTTYNIVLTHRQCNFAAARV